jgi:hypothetical protein
MVPVMTKFDIRALAPILASLVLTSACIEIERSGSEPAASANLAVAPGCGDSPDASVDAADPQSLWVFPTQAQFQGSFGGRVGADAKCQAAYQAGAFPRTCSLGNVHAVLGVDAIDSIPSMSARFGIPEAAPVRRAVDAALVASDWSSFVNPNAVLLNPVSTSSLTDRFWSGGATVTAHTCSSWTSSASFARGVTGDTTKLSGWLSTAAQSCDFLNRLVCVCW